MAAIFMQNSVLRVINTLQEAYPALRFEESDDAYWSAAEQTVFYTVLHSEEDAAVLLHETAHAALNHFDFSSDVKLIRIEVEAWQYAKERLAPLFGLVLDENIIQEHLETYRNWLRARSLCPSCGEVGLQTKTSTYQCINCQCSWRVNDARRCQLRRYKLTS